MGEKESAALALEKKGSLIVFLYFGFASRSLYYTQHANPPAAPRAVDLVPSLTLSLSYSLSLSLSLSLCIFCSAQLVARALESLKLGLLRLLRARPPTRSRVAYL